MAVDYANKVMLAPMVRMGTLPLRLLVLRYGADLVYTEELIDKKIIKCTRRVNHLLNTVDFIEPTGAVAFRTHPSEKERLIFQIGTADPELALQAALVVAQDVAAIDVNCGCPKHFSVQGGMGAALLTNQDLLKKILTTLVEKSGKPVTCKIRMLPNMEDTIKLVKMIESTGVRAIGVHCRTVKERPVDKGHWDIFKAIVEAVSIPIIANGDIFTLKDAAELKQLSNVSSVMIARGAIVNPSVFRKEGLLQLDDVIKDYMKLAIDYDQHPANVKYNLLQMLPPKHGGYVKISTAKSLRPMCEDFGLVQYYDDVIKKREERAKAISAEEQESLKGAALDADDKTMMPYIPRPQYIPDTHQHLIAASTDVPTKRPLETEEANGSEYKQNEAAIATSAMEAACSNEAGPRDAKRPALETE